mgnify:FL=1|jgi:hypothetical protein
MLEPLAIVLVLATIANRLVEGLVKPAWARANLDSFWLMYIAWAVAAVLVGLSGADAFEGYFKVPFAGQVLTAIAAGGGANILNDVLPSRKD